MALFNRREPDPAPVFRRGVTASYAGRLAFIGRRLDDDRCRAVVVLEMSGNYIVRAQNRVDNSMTLVEIVSDDFDAGVVSSSTEPPPSSYEVILGRIGQRLDQRVAANVAIVQTRSGYRIVGWERGFGGENQAYATFEESIDNWTAHRLAGGSS